MELRTTWTTVMRAFLRPLALAVRTKSEPMFSNWLALTRRVRVARPTVPTMMPGTMIVVHG